MKKVFFTRLQGKYLSDPVSDHARKHQKRLRQLHHQPAHALRDAEPVLHPGQPGQNCLFMQHRFELDFNPRILFIGAD